MLLLIWFLGWPCMMLGGWLFYTMLKKIVVPHNRFVFENSNEHGVVTLKNWDEAVRFQKAEVKKEFLELIVGLPALVLLAGGLMMIAWPTCYFIFW